jgi:RND superfamily putative drug exporter
MVDIQQMGFGLAVAIFLDATVVRCLLVPAAMRLLDNRNWYLPRWLHWLPDLRIEGAAHPAVPDLATSAPAPHSLAVSPFTQPTSRRPSSGD